MNRRKILATLGALGSMSIIGPWAWAATKIKPTATSVLLVIDVQNCFIEGGTLPVAKGSEVIPVINRIAPHFDNIVVAQDWHTQHHASFASSHAGKRPFETTQLSYGTQVLWPDHCVQGTADANLHKDLKLPSAQLILRKGYHSEVDSYSAFMEADAKSATGLSAYLKQRSIKTVFIVGLATDFCVASSAIDARSEGFETYVIEDACRAIDLNGSLAAAWTRMIAKGVKRIQSSELLSA